MPLTHETFEPRGGTPLLDATGRMIGKAAGRVATLADAGEVPERILFVTITDGQENQSHEHTRQQVVELVKAKQEAGWTFVFLGAGLDAYGEAGGLGYAAGSVQQWTADGPGAALAMSSLSRKTREFRDNLRADPSAAPPEDFFGDDKPAEDDWRERHGEV